MTLCTLILQGGSYDYLRNGNNFIDMSCAKFQHDPSEGDWHWDKIEQELDQVDLIIFNKMALLKLIVHEFHITVSDHFLYSLECRSCNLNLL